jgi:hypothetical protein
LKCSRSFLPIILKIFISGSFRISWLIVRFPFFRFIERIDGLKLHDKHQEHLSRVKHWFKELADTPIGQSLLKLDESQRKHLESFFNTAYGVVKAGKPFSDYKLICDHQVP